MKYSLTLTTEGEDDLSAFTAAIAQLLREWGSSSGAPSAAEIDDVAVEVPYSGIWDRERGRWVV